MATFLLNNVFRIAISTLNFVSPSIIADILLHPFDFATVLLQIGYAPEGCKHESASLVSIIVQYALFTFYIPYLLTTMQGLQFMGMPHPGILQYVNYVYRKEGFLGCYRGIVAKICERLIMICVNEKVRRNINKDVEGANEFENGREIFLHTLGVGLCSQFLAVIASHPFHVLMVSSFAEFTNNKKSSILQLAYSIYRKHGYFGFFRGLIARLLGELLSQLFSISYTSIINKQVRPQQTVVEIPMAQTTASQKTADLVSYVTDLSRFTAFRPKSIGSYEVKHLMEEDLQCNHRKIPRKFYEYYVFLLHFLENITQNKTPERARLRRRNIRRRQFPVLAYAPLTSKLFYYIMLRDFLSKKISNPFMIVCHCAILLDSGWDKFPLLTYFGAVS